MKIQNILKETPLPDDWDSSIYSDRVPIKHRVEYAKKKAARLGGGSSRIAFEIPYKGRKTVLKVAKNRKGMAQSEEEVGMMNTAAALGNEGVVTIPMIDFDDRSESPTWIHVEYASKLNSADEFKKLTGWDMEKLIHYAAKLSHNRSLPHAHNMEFDKEWVEKVWEKEDSYAYNFVSFIGNTEIDLSDLTNNLQNWGVYKGNPVIIDLGYTAQIGKEYYKR